MRRITLKYVKPGMFAGYAIHDKFGNLLIAQNERLDEESVKCLVDNGVPELFVHDKRVADILVVPMFSPALEGRLVEVLAGVIEQNVNGEAIGQEYIDELSVIIYHIIEDMSQNYLGDVNVAYNIMPQDYIVLQPVKTAGLAMALGHHLKLSDDEIASIGMAALLKDIGLPYELIRGGCSSTEANTPEMHGHPENGYNILAEGSLVSQEVGDAVLQHHEFWNGSGYPQGLKGHDISKYAQIISIADTFVDLQAMRPTGERYMSHLAIEYIMANAGDQFSPELVESFVRYVPSYPAGLTVELSSGEKGIISNPNRGIVARPIVRICYEPKKGSLDEPYDLDLAKSQYQTKLITKVLEYD